MRYTADDLIWWLRNCYNWGGPFINPNHILEADPTLEVNWVVVDEEHEFSDINVFDPKGGFLVSTTLDESNEIVWENWKEIPQ